MERTEEEWNRLLKEKQTAESAAREAEMKLAKIRAQSTALQTSRLFHIYSSIRKINAAFRMWKYGNRQLLWEKRIRAGKLRKAEMAFLRRKNYRDWPEITLLISCENKEAGALPAFFESIQKQIYQKWEILLVCEEDRQPELNALSGKIPAERVRFLSSKDLAKLPGIAKGDCVLLGGESISPDEFLLYEIAKDMHLHNPDMIYTDSILVKKQSGEKEPCYRPDFAPDYLKSNYYLGSLLAVRKDCLSRLEKGNLSLSLSTSGKLELALLLTEKEATVDHIPLALYEEPEMLLSKEEEQETKAALMRHLNRQKIKAEVMPDEENGCFRIRYAIEGSPLVSIIIPNKDHKADLIKCLDSIREKTTYENYEIIIIENNSTEPETFACYDSLKGNEKIRIISYQGNFNYSRINNYGFSQAKGDYVVLLNNDTEIISEDWIQEMLMYCQQKEVGAAGAKLYYPDNLIQHAGVIVGICGKAGHSHKYYMRTESGYSNRLKTVQDYSACTAACLMVRSDVWKKVEGLDEEYAVAFNDVDFCLKIREKGYRIVWTPYCELYHFESKSRGFDVTRAQRKRLHSEEKRLGKRWKSFMKKGDPYYNPNLTHTREDFTPCP